MTVKLEAILSIEDSLSNRLNRSWRKLAKKYKDQVQRELDNNDPVAAQAIAESIDMSPVFDENRNYIRMQTYASLLHGATRLTPDPKKTTVTTGIYEKKVERVLDQFRKQITGSATEYVRQSLVNLIALEFEDSTEETIFKGYDPKQPRHPKGSPQGGQWRDSDGAGLPMDKASRLARAREQGFDTSKVYYHGSKQDFDEFQPKYADGLTFLTTNREFAAQWPRGTGGLRTRTTGESGEKWTEQEVEALREVWNDKLGEYPEGDEGRRQWYDDYRKERNKLISARDVDIAIYPVYVRANKIFDPRTDYPLVETLFNRIHWANPDQGWDQLLSQGKHKEGNWLLYEREDVISYLRDTKGYDAIWLKESAFDGEPHETLAIFDPKNVRSVNAAFDPKYKDSTNILKDSSAMSGTDFDVLKYDPNQLRYPKGHPKGGQWRTEGSEFGPEGPPVKARLGEPQSIGQSRAREKYNERAQKPFDPASALKDLIETQRQFSEEGDNRGIRVDAKLEGDPLPVEDLKTVMSVFGGHRSSMESFVLDQGQEFKVPDSPPQIDLMTPKECFKNAAELTAMAFDDKYDYVEGFVMDRELPFPIHHAWVSPKGANEVVDPTLGWRPLAAYMGVKMTNKFLRRKLVENGYYGVMTDGIRLNPVVLGEDEDFDYK